VVEMMYEFLLTKEAAALLKVSEEYIRELIRHGKLKAIKISRRSGYRINRRDLEDFIEDKYKKMELKIGGR
jgi:excisionase family DNA binding protein